MKGFCKKIVIMLSLLILLSFNTLGASFAQEPESSETDKKIMDTLEILENATEDIENASEEEHELYINKVEELLNEGSLDLKTDEVVDLEGVFVQENSETKEVSVQIPVLFGEDRYEIATVYFSNGEMTSSMINHYTANFETHEVTVEIWNNNEKVLDSVVELEEKYFEDETQKEESFVSSLDIFGAKKASANTFTDFVKGFNNCLSAQGIAAWAVAAGSLACAGLGPVGMHACYTGLSFMTGGVLGYCWTSAKYYL